MAPHVLVAEPSNDTWTSIAHGVSRYQPKATLLRVKDGEQAIRFLFQRGLLMPEPETPDLIVLNSELPIVPASAVLARIRQHPRTLAIPVIVISHEPEHDSENSPERQKWVHQHFGTTVLTGTQTLEKEVALAMHRLSETSSCCR